MVSNLLGECLLVNVRLAILDLSERGRMPMSNADGTVWITYNGEVYNAAELRRDLDTARIPLPLDDRYGSRPAPV